jgi:acyl carrier protein
MSVDPPLVAPELGEQVRSIVSEVLLVPRESVRFESALIGDLGAESIDFLDMVFRIEDIVGHRIHVSRWGTFIAERLPGADLTRAITTAVVVEFAESERVA